MKRIILFLCLLTISCAKHSTTSSIKGTDESDIVNISINMTNYIYGLTNNLDKISVFSPTRKIYQTTNRTDYFIVCLTAPSQTNTVKLLIDYNALYIRGFLNNSSHFYYFYQNPKFEVFTNMIGQKTASSLGYTGSYPSLGGLPEQLSLNLIENDINTLLEYKGDTDIRTNLARIIVVVVEASRFKILHDRYNSVFDKNQTYQMTPDDDYFIHHWAILSQEALINGNEEAIQVLSIAKTH